MCKKVKTEATFSIPESTTPRNDLKRQNLKSQFHELGNRSF